MDFNVFEMPLLLFFHTQIALFLAVGAFSRWLLGPFHMTLVVFNGLFAFWYDNYAPDSSCIFPAPDMELIFFLSSPSPL